MALNHPPLINATPGDPITSEGWNNIIQSIKTLYETHNQTASRLNITLIDDADNNVIKNAMITIVAEKSVVLTASFAGAEIQKYLVTNIAAGNYKLFAEAVGYSKETRDLVVPESGEPINITIEMTKTTQEKKVPNLFGLKLSAADTALKNSGFLLNRVIDSHGKDLTQEDITELGGTVKVLNQVPEAGLLHEAGGAVALLVSAKAAFEQRVKVPDLQGLSLNEARTALESVGLVLGETNTIASK